MDCMDGKLTLPDLNWFEFEILSLMLEKRKYGNQLLNELKGKFGEDSVSSGKLYPVLYKLEKRKLIRRAARAGGRRKAGATRGVDRVYFQVTPEGRAQVEKATFYSTSNLIQSLFTRLQGEVVLRTYDIIKREVGDSIRCGVVTPGWEREMPEFISRWEIFRNVRFYHMVLALGDSETVAGGDQKVAPNVTRMYLRGNEVPLKNDYLDAMTIIMILHSIDDWKPFLKEAIRVLRPGGMLLVMDYARFESYILEALMKHFDTAREGKPLVGLDEKELTGALGPMLKKVRTERMKEILLAYGKKPG